MTEQSVPVSEHNDLARRYEAIVRTVRQGAEPGSYYAKIADVYEGFAWVLKQLAATRDAEAVTIPDPPDEKEETT